MQLRQKLYYYYYVNFYCNRKYIIMWFQEEPRTENMRLVCYHMLIESSTDIIKRQTKVIVFQRIRVIL